MGKTAISLVSRRRQQLTPSALSRPPPLNRSAPPCYSLAWPLKRQASSSSPGLRAQSFPKTRPLPSYSIPYKAKAVPVAAQFNEIVSEGPKPAWEKSLAHRPSGYNFLHYVVDHITVRQHRSIEHAIGRISRCDRRAWPDLVRMQFVRATRGLLNFWLMSGFRGLLGEYHRKPLCGRH